MSEALLEIRGLKSHFACDDGMILAVEDVDHLLLGVVEQVGQR